MLFEPFAPFVATQFRVKFAVWPWERAGAAALRRRVFCDEQNIFETDDRDTIDDIAIPIIALSTIAGESDEIVGTVRLHEAAGGVWWGSRLAVDKPHRRIGALGVSLIKVAVGAAKARGCTRFLAHVQSQNAKLFHGLHWRTLDESLIHGRPHHFMEADIARYAAIEDPVRGLTTLRRAA